jgi:hypothetical protein
LVSLIMSILSLFNLNITIDITVKLLFFGVTLIITGYIKKCILVSHLIKF